ncbi:hypothetical protein BJV74DRAFT_2107 [Russula compacta]|nr:hypothetical protein BJV74DRAFT_2107 [Russula compacta]
MAIPEPPANSLGLDLVHPERAVDSQPTSLSSPSPPQLTTQSSTDTASPTATDAATAPTTPVTGTTKTDDATISNVSKKVPYVNPERVKTGGLPRNKLTDEELAERMARMREQNEKIKQRRLDVAADEDAFKQTQASERQRHAQMRKVQDTVDRTREQSARRKMDKIQSREWDSEKKAEGWPKTTKPEQPAIPTSDSTTRDNPGDDGAEAEASPTVKPHEDTNRGRGSGRRGRGRGRRRGQGRDKAPSIGEPQGEEGK